MKHRDKYCTPKIKEYKKKHQSKFVILTTPHIFTTHIVNQVNITHTYDTGIKRNSSQTQNLHMISLGRIIIDEVHVYKEYKQRCRAVCVPVP